MHVFRDATLQAREWALVITVETLRRVKALCSVDLLDVVKPPRPPERSLLERLVDDPVMLADVLYAVCRPECEARGVTDEQFGRLLVGDVIDLATAALLEELADFFPQSRRAVLKKALAKMHAFEERITAAALARLDDPALDAELDAVLRRALGDSGGSSPSSPASSASTPAPAP